MTRQSILLSGVTVAAAGLLGAARLSGALEPPAPPPSAGRVPDITPVAAAAGESVSENAAERAERLFFEALNRRPDSRPEAMTALWEAVAAEPSNGRLSLGRGLGHLGIAAESAADSREAVEHAILAEHYLTVASRLMPEDDRIVSWLAPLRIRLGQRSGDTSGVEQAWADLPSAVKRDPCFHAVSLALLCFDRPADSREFVEGLDALRAAAACGPDDPSVQNRDRWPHNLEGFALVLAQYELKAGHRQRAEGMLMFAQERPSYPQWPHRAVLEGLFQKLGNDPAGARDSALVIAPGSAIACRICHQGQEEPPR